MAGLGSEAADLVAMTSGPVTPEMVADLLTDVIDPELGVDIVNLGLVYDIAVTTGQVMVRMTLTTPGCPLGGYLDDEVSRCLAQLPGAPAVRVDLVWQPRWRPEMMSDRAKAMLGWHR